MKFIEIIQTKQNAPQNIKEDIFKPTSKEESKERQEEYLNITLKKVSDKLNNGKPIKVGDYLKTKFFNIIPFKDTETGFKYSIITHIHLGYHGSYMGDPTVPLMVVKEVLTSIPIKGPRFMNPKHEEYFNMEDLLDDKYWQQPVGEFLTPEEFKRETSSINESEDIFKPASKEDQESRTQQYYDNTLKQNLEAQKTFTSKYGQLNPLDIIVRFDIEQPTHQQIKIYKVIELKDTDPHSNTNYKTILNPIIGPHIRALKIYPHDYPNNYFDLPYSTLLNQDLMGQLSIYHPSDPLYRVYINKANLTEQTSIFQPASKQDSLSRQQEFLNLQLKKNNEDKDRFIKEFGTPQPNDIIEVKFEGNQTANRYYYIKNISFNPFPTNISFSNQYSTLNKTFGDYLSLSRVFIQTDKRPVGIPFSYTYADIYDIPESLHRSGGPSNGSIHLLKQGTPEYSQIIQHVSTPNPALC